MKRLLYALLCIGATTFLPILLLAQPTANFSATPTMGCSPIVVQFTDLSTGGPTSWQWNLGNGTNSALQNPSTTYITAGTYTVTLTVTNAGGSNTKTITNYITVLPTPTVNFSANATTVCVPGTVQFTNLSTPGGSGTPNYYWDFGDGTNSTATNPTHTYSNVGQYNVTLEVTNGNGCSQSLTMSQYINVIAIPTASFSANNTSFCSAPATVNFTNSSTGATSYTWNFGDGGTSTSSNPSHTYNTSGNFTVTLIAKNASGCSDTLTMPNYIVVGNSQASFSGPTNVCIGASASFTNNSTPTGGSSTWYFGDGGSANSTNATHTYGSAGTYTVTLVYNISGCSDTAKQVITVHSLPTVSDAVSSYYNCKTPFTVNFTNSSTGATSYLWNFGDGGTSTLTNPSHTYTTIGVYSVLLTATNSYGCSASTTLPAPYYIVIGPATGTITASPPTGCAPQSVSFSTNVTNGYVSLNPTGANINFGDGSSANIVSGSHTYTNPGTYNVTYTFTVTGGCVYTATTTVILGAPPVPNFSANPTTVCVGQNVSFTNSSTGATSYLWLFGDGSTSTQTSPSYSYGAPGTYTVTLIASNAYCSDTIVMPNLITVNPPLALFSTVLTNCSNRYAFTFTNNSIGATSDNWDFGDGSTSTSTATTVTHTYSAYGTYTVTLTVANSSTGCTNTKTMVVPVFPMVDTFNANHLTLCKGNSVTFTGTVNSSGYYSNYNWNFGDGTSSNTSGNVKTHTYNTPGIYTVRLIITDMWGCLDTLTKTNYIEVGGPTVSYVASPTTGCPGLTVGFTNNTNGYSFTPLTYAWSFGDGGTSTITSPSHTYNTTGNFTSQLTATDILGCTGSANVTISVAVPTAQFTANDTAICYNGSVIFSNTSTGAVSYSWTFGDGGTSTSASPTHVYTTPGYYTVTLTATNSYGCTNTMTRTAYIHVESFPVSFTLSDTVSSCPPLSVSVVSTSPSNIATYAWTFGNGGQAVSSNPSTLYTYPGNYTVKLIATNSIGCVDSATQAVTIHGPTGTLSYSSVSGCLPVTVTLTATSQNATSITWDMNNGYTQVTSGSQTTFTYTYTSPGLFTPLIVLSNGSCQVPILGIDTIRVDGIYVDFTYAPTSLCQGGTVNFIDTTSSPLSAITSMNWTFGDGGTATGHNPSHTYASPGTYTVRLIISNATGCHDTATKIVTVHGHPTVIAGTSQTICLGQATGVTLSASGASTYAWSPGTGLSCTACANPTALPTMTTTYSVIGIDSFGCSGTASVTITVVPSLSVTATANPPAICSGTSTTISGSGATSYVWSPATGLSCTNCQSATATPTITTTYIVTGSNGTCSNTATVTVTINPLPNISGGGNVAICQNTSTTLQGTGGVSYVWSPGTGLSCTSCANPTANPTVTTTYTVTGTDANGCHNTSLVTVTVNPLPTVTVTPTQTLCQGQTTPVQLNAGGATNYTWTPATGLSCTNCSNPTALPTVTTTYSVTGTDGNGCSNTATVQLQVLPLPTVTATANPPAICSGTSTTISGGGATTYAWSPATGLSCTNCQSTTANPTTTTTYVVTGNNGACSNTASVTVTINPLPNISGGGNVAICQNTSTTLQGTGGVSYVWSPGTGLSCTSCANPTANPTVTTTYTVTGTDANGCHNTSLVTVTVNPLPTVTVTPTQTLCQGQTTPVQLNAGGATTYAWTPATGLSCTNCSNPTALPTVTTTYSVTGTDGNGCSNTASVLLQVLPLPTVTATANPPAICSGTSTTISGGGATTYAWSPATGLSCTNCQSTTANPTTTTTYVVTGNNGTCSNTASVTVTINPLPNISGGGNVAICQNTSTTLGATGGTSYVWSPGTGLSCTSCANPTANPTVTTTYTVTGTDANGCQNTSLVTVTVNPLPTVTVTPTQTLCQGQTTPVQLNAGGATNYTWTPATGLSCTNCANPTALPTVTTTYSVTGTDGNGCSNMASVLLQVLPLPTVTATANPPAICSGTSTTISGGGATNYTWSPGTGLSCTNCQSTTANPTTTTTYVVTGNNGTCSNTASVTVTINPLPNISGGGNVAICQNTSTTLGATGGTSYVWSPGTGLSCTSCANPTANPTVTTTYTVTGTDANGCQNTSLVTVTVNPLPTVTVTPTQTLCQGQTTPVQLNAGGATNYTWTPATGLSCTNCSNPTALPTVTTTYSVTGTDGNGCSNTASVLLQVLPLPTVTATANPPAICSGTSTTISGSGATSYVWSPATGLSCTNCQSATATPTITTTYIVTGSNGTCSNTATVTVTINPLPNISGGGNVAICQNTSTTLQGTGGVSYVWSPGTGLSCTSCANPTANPTVTTTYTVTGTDANGCHNTSLVTVTVNPLPTVTVTPTQTLCQGQTTPVQLNAGGATNYTWTPATGLSCTNCSNPTALPTVTTTYSVTGTDGNGCSNTATVQLQVLPLPTVTATANPPAICSGTSTTISGGGATTYAWSPATGLSCTNCQSTTANPTTTTTYVVTGNNGACSNTASVTVTINPLPNISGGGNVAICQNTSTTLQGTGGVSYVWSPGTGLSCTSCANPTANPTVTTTYTVTGTDANGCHNTSLVTVTVNPLPTVTVTPTQTLCQGQTTPVQLNAGGATTYAWTPATGLSCTNCSNPTALPTVTTTYSVTGTDGNGCSNTASVLLQVLPLPTVTATANPPAICSGTSTTISGGGATTYAWSPATGLSCTNCQSTTANPTTTTTYVVTGNNGTCSNTASVTVTINPLPNISGGGNVAICQNTSTTLGATGGTSYVWSPGTGLSCTSCANPTANPTVTTTYTVTGTDANGCQNTSLVTVTVNPLPTVTVTPTQTLCQGQTTPVQLNAGGATNYTWTPATGLSCTNCANPTALPTVTTTYSVTGTDGNGCSNMASVLLQVLPLPTVTATANPPAICSGTSTTISGGGATTYAWSPATGLSCTNCQSTTANPTTTTTYTVTGNNGTCSSTATVTVTVNPLPTVNAGLDTAVCLGSSVQLQATGTINYAWSPSAGLSCTNCANPLATPAVTTQYIVTGTDANGCNKKDTVNVTVRQLPVVTAANQAICPGGSVNLLANGAVSYIWSPGASLSCTACSNPVSTPTTTTTYTISGTDGFGCVNTGTVTVTINPLPDVSATTTNPKICIGSTTQLQAGGANNYTWSPATGLSCTNCANPIASPSLTTTYTLTGVNGTNCSGTTTITITVNPLPAVYAGIDTGICAGSSTQLLATGANTYIWSPAGGLSCTNCTDPTAAPTVTTTYVVTGTDTNSCVNYDTVNVTVYALPSITAANNKVCIGSSVQLLASGSSTYTWSPATGLSCTNCANPSASPTITTIYTITGVNVHGCIDSSQVTVTVDSLPVIVVDTNRIICNGTTVQLHASGANTYAWSPAAGLSCNNCAAPYASPSDTTTYMVTGTDNNGCTDTNSVTVNVLPKPVVSAGQDRSICKGNSVQLQATGASTYVWSPSTGLSCINCDTTTANPGVPVTYTVIGTGADGCLDTSHVTVNIYTQPVIGVEGEQTICNGASDTLTGTGGQNYTWSPATALSCTNCNITIASPTVSTTYMITGTDANGCMDSGRIAITVIQPVATSVGKNDTICVGQSAQLSANGGNAFMWLPSQSLDNNTSDAPVATPDTTTQYSVFITENECFTDTSYVTVVVNDNPTVTLGPDMKIIAGSSVPLVPQTTGSINTYAWSPASTLNCNNCQSPMATPSATTTYTVVVSTNAGCQASAQITLDLGCDKSQVFIPNTFTPNGDGVNDRFFVSGKGITIIKQFSVYDRWGELLYEAENIPINDPHYGWDGTYKGAKLNPDVYVYIISATCEAGDLLRFKGDISIVR